MLEQSVIVRAVVKDRSKLYRDSLSNFSFASFTFLYYYCFFSFASFTFLYYYCFFSFASFTFLYYYCFFSFASFTFLYCDFNTIRCSLILTVCDSKSNVIGASFIKGGHNCFFIAFYDAIIVQVPANGIGFCTTSDIRFKLKCGWCNTFCVI